MKKIYPDWYSNSLLKDFKLLILKEMEIVLPEKWCEIDQSKMIYLLF